MAHHILRIDCPDRAGLVYQITGVLFRHGCNILSNHEFVDPTTSHFFMRTAFTTETAIDGIVPELETLLPTTARLRLAIVGKRPVVVLATKEAHCLGELLLRHAYEEFPAQILAVISNYATLAPLATQFGIPFHHITHEGRERDAHEAQMLACAAQYAPAYLVLAKYMRVLTPAFVAQYPDRILNIHHSFLPAFIGASPYRQAFARGVKQIGATGHIVTNELDTGPIIAQSVLPVDHTATPASMAQAGRDVEKLVLAQALRLLLEDRVFLHQGRTVVFA